MALLLWAASMATMKFELGPGGLVYCIPALYYLAFGLLAVSFALMVKYGARTIDYAFSTTVLVLMLFTTPALVEGVARISNSWDKYGYLDYALRYEGLDRARAFFHTWPGLYLLGVSIVDVTGLDPNGFLLMYPTMLMMATVPVVVALAKALGLDKTASWMAAWFFLIANWVDQEHFTSQGLGLTVALVLLLVAVKLLAKGSFDVKLMVCFVTFSALLFATHFLTFLFTACTILLFWLISPSRAAFGKVLASKRNRVIMAVSVVAAVVAFVYIWDFASYYLSTIFGGGPQVFEMFSGYLDKMFSGGAEHQLAVYVRVAFSGVVLALLAWWLLSIRKENPSRFKFMAAMVASAIAPAFVLSYGGEILQRFFLFSLIPISLMMVALVKDRKAAAIVFVFALLLPVHLVAHYGNERMDYMPASEIEATNFFFEHSLRGDVVVSGRNYLDHRDRELHSNRAFTISEIEGEGNRTVWVSSSLAETLDFYHGDTTTVPEADALLASGDFNKIYSNGRVEIFKTF